MKYLIWERAYWYNCGPLVACVSDYDGIEFDHAIRAIARWKSRAANEGRGHSDFWMVPVL